jgi:hypothetical protein
MSLINVLTRAIVMSVLKKAITRYVKVYVTVVILTISARPRIKKKDEFDFNRGNNKIKNLLWRYDNTNIL